jgi:flagellar motility protein MotE (MotC chaperone)
MNTNETDYTYSFFQKTLYFFVLPIIYTIVLFLILMYFFGHRGNSFSNTLLNTEKQAYSTIDNLISKKNEPNAVVSQTTTTESGNPSDQNNLQSTGSQQKLEQLQNEIKQKDDSNQVFQKQLQDLTDQLKNKQLSEEELKKKADDLAQEYGSMQPSQAANIISSMNMNDAVFALSSMKIPQRAGILAKISDPKKSAEISIALKDFTISKDSEIASLQAKLNNLTNSKQSIDELVNTFAQMPPQSAAKIIEEILKTDEPKAIKIMSLIPTAQRAQILSTLSTDKTNPEGTKEAAVLAKNF